MAERLMGLRVYWEEVPVMNIIFNRLNIRGILRSPEQIQRIAESIRSTTLIHHPVISQTVNGPLIVAGECRTLAHQLLLAQGYDQYKLMYVKVCEGMDEELAMKILAEENLSHGTRVPAATANEVYWHYRFDYTTSKNHKLAVQKTQGIWGNRNYVFSALIVPGWLLYHCSTVQKLLQAMGPKREYITEDWTQETSSNLRKMRLGWLYRIAMPFRPMTPEELLKVPSSEALGMFELLLKEAFDMVKRGAKGKEAELALEELVLPIRKQRLEKFEAEGQHDPAIARRIERELGKIIRLTSAKKTKRVS